MTFVEKWSIQYPHQAKETDRKACKYTLRGGGRATHFQMLYKIYIYPFFCSRVCRSLSAFVSFIFLFQLLFILVNSLEFGERHDPQFMHHSCCCCCCYFACATCHCINQHTVVEALRYPKWALDDDRRDTQRTILCRSTCVTCILMIWQLAWINAVNCSQMSVAAATHSTAHSQMVLCQVNWSKIPDDRRQILAFPAANAETTTKQKDMVFFYLFIIMFSHKQFHWLNCQREMKCRNL